MIVNDFHINRSAVFPAETNPPLLVDSDAELTGPIADKFPQTIAGRHAQILDAAGTFEQEKFPQRHMLQSGKSSRPFAKEYPVRFAAPETSDHAGE